MVRKIRLFLLATVSVLMLSGCVDLKALNEYSIESLDGLHGFAETGFSFEQFCLQNCELEQMQNARFVTTLNCDCNTAHVSDSVTVLLLNTVKGYYRGLADLSANDLTTYNTDTLANAISGGNFGSLRLDAAVTSAYSSLAGLLLHAATDNYRRRQLKQFIEKANQPIQTLLGALQQIAGTEISRLYTSQQTRFQAFYDNLLLKTESGYERASLVKEYYGHVNELKARQRQLDAIAQSLAAMARGHQVLYDHRNKLSARELKSQITLYASQIGDLVSQFNTLKN